MANPQPTQTVIVTQERSTGNDCCYQFWCPPCWIHSYEGCSPMAAVCCIACFFFWPFNGICALCYEPKPRTTITTVHHQPAYAQPQHPAPYPQKAQPQQGSPAGYPQPEYANASAPYPAPAQEQV
eukprot:TRINITY_DN759_c2_g1_i1.p1 TRINITY_DN759_c2_g1~~TRINITY_DN759_c2_g1_i1.p1  ORF type:complete len:143 (+),score=9.32 TRINITY_DN759_c2_g1_i1:56-430(+)